MSQNHQTWVLKLKSSTEDKLDDKRCSRAHSETPQHRRQRGEGTNSWSGSRSFTKDKKNQKWHRISEQHHCKLENNESSMPWVELFPTWNDLQSQTMWEAGKGIYRHATSQKFYLPPKEEKKSRKRKTEMPRYRRSNTKVSLRKFLMITKVGRTCRPSWING